MTVEQAKSHGAFWSRNGRSVTLARVLAKVGELRDAYGEHIADAFIDGVLVHYPSLRSYKAA